MRIDSRFRDFLSISSLKYHDGVSEIAGSSGYYGLYEIAKDSRKNKKYSLIKEKGYFVNLKRALTWIDFSVNTKVMYDILHGDTLIDGRLFVPKYMKRRDYMINCLMDEIDTLRDYWKLIYEDMIKQIKTPGEAAQVAWTSTITSGYMDVDDAHAHQFVAQYKREAKYNFLLESILVQVIHQIASRFEYAFANGLGLKGEKFKTFDRKVFYDIVKSATGKTYEKLTFHKGYTDVVILWNFIKHNNESSFEEVKKKCPYFLNDENVEFLDRGSLAINYLDLRFDLIDSLLSGLEKFSIELCEVLYKEKIEEAKWNYYEFFLQNAYETYISELEPNYM